MLYSCIIMVLGIFIPSKAFSMKDMMEWSLYKQKYAKEYDSVEEDMHHFQIYLYHKWQIIEHNHHYESGLESFELGINEYTDIAHNEFVSTRNGYLPPRNESSEDMDFVVGAPRINGKMPKSIDWRKHGAVTRVKNQLSCSSCWSFSAIGVLEGQYFLKTGHRASLSEQSLVDCSLKNHGCKGGSVQRAFAHIQRNGGIETEQSYPYTGYDDSCRKHRKMRRINIRGLAKIPYGDEEALQQALATVGPIAAAIDASLHSFRHYKRGIYHDHACTEDNLTHGVLLVGYDTDEHGREYYIAKNSWGSKWGERGYIKLQRNHRNHCGIASQAVYPIL